MHKKYMSFFLENIDLGLVTTLTPGNFQTRSLVSVLDLQGSFMPSFTVIHSVVLEVP